LIFLGVIFDFNGTLWNLMVAWSAARLTGRIVRGATFKVWFDRIVGSLFVVVGLKLMWSRDQ
jgi:threonine/homoserine/homoserine lactone efflux protein